MGMYQGVNASEGIGIVAVDPDLTFEPHEVADSAAEKERYQSALSVFCEKTQAQADHMKETVGEAEAEIMSGHIVLAQDPGMTDAITAAIYGSSYQDELILQEYIPGDDNCMRVLNAYCGLDHKVKLMALGRPLLEEQTPEGIGNYAAILSDPEYNDAALLEKLNEREREIDHLQAQLDKLRRMNFGSRSEKVSRRIAQMEADLNRLQKESDRERYADW